MNNKKEFFIAIVAVLAIIGVVSGGTFAYWTWVSGTTLASNQTTNVVFTLPSDASAAGLSASIEGAGTATATNIKPTPCTNSSYAIVKTVPITYKNETNQAAVLTATLSVTSFTFRSASYKPTSTTLGSLKWAVRSSAATSATTSSPNTCSTDQVTGGSFNVLSIPSSGTTASNLPTTLGSFTINVPANTQEHTDNYYLYIWLDYNYSHENTGTTNSDPMQGLNFTVQWSGTINNSN